MMKIVRWLGMLAQDYKRCFMIFMTGQSVFFVGIAFFYLSAKHYDAQPLLSELVAFLGMLLICIGILVALIGYLSLTYGRWYHFFRRRPAKVDPAQEDDLTENKLESSIITDNHDTQATETVEQNKQQE